MGACLIAREVDRIIPRSANRISLADASRLMIVRSGQWVVFLESLVLPCVVWGYDQVTAIVTHISTFLNLNDIVNHIWNIRNRDLTLSMLGS